jgi:hypothetical protein
MVVMSILKKICKDAKKRLSGMLQDPLKNSYLRIAIFLQVTVCLFSSCLPYRYTKEEYLSNKEHTPTTEECQLVDHWLYQAIPPHRSLIRWYDLPHWLTWTLLGNDDDGLFGEGPCANYRSDLAAGQRALRWTLRNPFHNLTFYALGSAGSRNSQFTLLSLSGEGIQFLQYKKEADTVFASNNTSLYLAFHGWKPFGSFRFRYSPTRSFDTYLGWRERGNLGAKFRPWCSTPQ